MAIGRPGPLLDEIFGSIAGTTFSRMSSGVRVSRRPGRRSTSATFPLSYRSLISQAVTTWSSLSRSAQKSWYQSYSPSRSPRQAFIASCASQFGDVSYTIPPPPPVFPGPAPIVPIFDLSTPDILLPALSRNFSSDEYLLIRVRSAIPAYAPSRRPRVFQYHRIDDDGLDNRPYLAVVLPSLGAKGFTTSLSAPPSTWSIGIWFYPTEIQPGTQSIWYSPSYTWQLIFSPYNKNLKIRSGSGVYYTINQSPSLFHWHYVELTHSSPSNDVSLFLDGVLVWGPFTLIGSPPGGTLYVGNNVAGTQTLRGRFADLSIYPFTRTLVQSQSTWNSGVGHVVSLTDGPLHAWHFRDVISHSSDALTPSTPPFVFSDDSSDFGFPVRLIYPSSATPLISPRLVHVFSRVHRPDYHLSPSFEDVITW